MRYQTSSISRNAKPVTAAAPSTNQAGAAAGAAGASASLSAGASRRPARAARPAIARFTAAASHSVRRVPNASNSQNVDSRQPATAPSVLTP